MAAAAVMHPAWSAVYDVWVTINPLFFRETSLCAVLDAISAWPTPGEGRFEEPRRGEGGFIQVGEVHQGRRRPVEAATRGSFGDLRAIPAQAVRPSGQPPNRPTVGLPVRGCAVAGVCGCRNAIAINPRDKATCGSVKRQSCVCGLCFCLLGSA